MATRSHRAALGLIAAVCLAGTLLGHSGHVVFAAETVAVTLSEALRFRDDFGLRADKEWVAGTLDDGKLDSKTWACR